MSDTIPDSWWSPGGTYTDTSADSTTTWGGIQVSDGNSIIYRTRPAAAAPSWLPSGGYRWVEARLPEPDYIEAFNEFSVEVRNEPKEPPEELVERDYNK